MLLTPRKGNLPSLTRSCQGGKKGAKRLRIANALHKEGLSYLLPPSSSPTCIRSNSHHQAANGGQVQSNTQTGFPNVC